jgi:hypothetical protein
MKNRTFKRRLYQWQNVKVVKEQDDVMNAKEAARTVYSKLVRLATEIKNVPSVMARAFSLNNLN